MFMIQINFPFTEARHYRHGMSYELWMAQHLQGQSKALPTEETSRINTTFIALGA